MSHKRVVKRRGKTYGPYLYESYRDGYGNVKKRYLGKVKEDVAQPNFSVFVVIGAVLLLAFLLNFNFTGNVVLSLDNVDLLGENLSGNLEFVLQQSELLPENTNVIISTTSHDYSYSLSELLSTETTEGDFFLVDKSISGYGSGYGLSLERFPPVGFVLGVYEVEQGREYNVPEPEEIDDEQGSGSRTIPEEIPEIEEPEETETQQTPEETSGTRSIGITGMFTMTGYSVLNLIEEVNGSVKYGEEFVYSLDSNQQAEVIYSEQEVDLQVINNDAVVSTNYIGDESIVYEISLSELDIPFEYGILNVSFVYDDEILMQASKEITIDTQASKDLSNGTRDLPFEPINFSINGFGDDNLSEALERGVLVAPNQSYPWIGAHNRLTSGLVGEWRFENGNSTFTEDETGVNNGSVVGATLSNDGRVGRGYDFDGVNDYVTTSLSTGEYSTSFWFKTTDAGGTLIGGVCQGIASIILGTGGKVNARLSSADNVKTTSTFNDGVWHHVVFTSDSIYVDGNNQSTEAGTTLTSTEVMFGARENSGYGGFLNVSIDEVAIWNKSLTATEISELYNTSRGAYAYTDNDLGCSVNGSSDVELDSYTAIYNWYLNGSSIAVLNMPFEGGSNATYTKDYSSFGNDGAVTDATWNATGGHDGFGAYEFDGVNDAISIPFDNSLNITKTNNLSLCWWVNAGTIAPDQYFFENLVWGDCGIGVLRYNPNDRLYFYVGYSNSTGDANWVSNYLNDGTLWADYKDEWHHFCQIEELDGNTLNHLLYIDGVSKTVRYSSSSDVIELRTCVDEVFTIGNDDGGGNFLNGTIDEVLIFNRTLSAEQIKSIYESGLRNIVSEETERAENWSCGVTLADAEDASETYLSSSNITLSETDAVPLFYNAVNTSSDYKYGSNFTANITLTDDLGIYKYIFATNASGVWVNTTTYLSNENYSASHQANISVNTGNSICWYYYAEDGVGQSNMSEEYCFEVKDSIAPNVTINTPLNQTYNTTIINFNITSVDDYIGIDSCWVTIDGGVTNYTLLNTTYVDDYNYTNSSMTQGSKTAKFYCNDSNNNINNSENVTFTINNLWFETDYPLAEDSFRITDFVNVSGDNFTLGGQQYRIQGTNFYYATDYMTGLTYSDNGELIEDSDDDVYEVLNEMQYLGTNVFRTWFGTFGGNNNGTNATWEQDTTGGHYNFAINDYPGNYNETYFVALDKLIYEASQRDIRIEAVLINNWNAYGGMQWFLSHSSTSDKTYEDATYLSDNWWTWHDQFFTDSEAQDEFQDFINYTLNRNNTYTGTLYKDDPTIFAWFISNEPRIKTDNHSIIRDWCNDTTNYIKGIDDKHLVTCGIEGLGFDETWGEGHDITICNDTTEDFCTIALNTGQWGYMVERVETWNDGQYLCDMSSSNCHIGNANVRDFWGSPLEKNYTYNEKYHSGTAYWIPQLARHTYNSWARQNAEWANEIGKPIMLQEFVVDQAYSDSTKDDLYEKVISTWFTFGGDGLMYWTLNSDSYYRDSSTSSTGNQDDGYGFYVSDDDTLNERSASTIKAFNFTHHNNTGGTSWVNTLNHYKYDFTVNVIVPSGSFINNCSLYLNISNGTWQGNSLDQTNTSAILSGIDYVFTKEFDDDTEEFTWYVECVADDSSTIQSTVEEVVLETSTPQVNLNEPANESFINEDNIDFNYTATNTLDISYCEFYIDEVLNQTDTVVTKNIKQSFPMTGTDFSEGNHTWYVFCKDVDANTDTSDTRQFTVDYTYPLINIETPTNNTNYSYNTVDVNYTYTEINPDTCWYSNDTMSENTTITCGTNITDVVWIEGQHNVTVWINDSANNVNSSLVTFLVDTVYPQISISTPTNNTNSSDTGLDVNYTFTEINPSACWYSNDSMSENITFASCGDNITDVVWIEGQHNTTIWINDSANNVNFSSVVFTIDTTNPVFSSASNTSNEFKRYENFTANITIDDVHLDTYIFSTNASGSWVNTTVSIVGNTTYTASHQANITLSQGNSICWYYYANDTLNNEDYSTEYCFIVNNSAPVMRGIIANSSLGTNDSFENLICYANATDLDNNTLNYTGYWYKNSVKNISINASDSYASGDLINVSTLDSSYTSVGDNWTCNVSAYDGNDYSSYNSTENITIVDILSPQVNITSPTTITYSSGSVGIEINLNEAGYCEYSMNAGVSNSTLTNTTSATKHTGSLFLGNGAYTLNAYCNDSYGNNNYTENVSFTVAIPSDDTGDTGGGGGATASTIKKLASLEVVPDSLEIVTVKGIKDTRILKIKNTGDTDLSLTVRKTGEIVNIVQTVPNIIIAKGETKDLVVNINAPDKGLLSGKIIFEALGSRFEIPVIINVKSENFLFDIGVSLPKEMKYISSGEILQAQIDLLQVGPQEKVDVKASYVIKDFEGNVYLEESETFYVLGEKNYIKEIYTDGLPYGKYFVGLEIVYPGAFATSSTQFEIVQPLYAGTNLILIAGALFIIAMIVAIYFLRKRRLKLKLSRK